MVLGRKNYLGMYSPRGAKRRVPLYTLMEPCKRNRPDSYRYMREMTRAQFAGGPFPIPANYRESLNGES